MQRIHIIGRKNHGKTTLLVELVEEFTLRGLRVGTIKHTHHQHELDIPGKDSHRHRTAGAAMSGILSRTMNAVFWPVDDETDNLESQYEPFSTIMTDCDLVLVEGDLRTDAAKIEVWRESVGSAPLAKSDPSILAIVSDEDPKLAIPIHRRSDVQSLAAWILKSRF